MAMGRPALLLHGRVINMPLDAMCRIYEAAETQAREFRVLENMIAAVPIERRAVNPLTHPKSVVLRFVKPKGLMMSEYWFVRPLAISWDQTWKKNSQVLGSLIASINWDFLKRLCSISEWFEAICRID